MNTKNLILIGMCIMLLLPIGFSEFNVSQNLVAYWDFDNNTNSNNLKWNGTIVGNATYVDNGLKFDGNDYVDLTNGQIMFSGKNYTFSYWANTTATGINVIFSKGKPPATDRREIYLLNDLTNRRVEVGCHDTLGNFREAVGSNNKLTINTFQHIVVTIQKGIIKFYVDGAYDKNANFSALNYCTGYNNEYDTFFGLDITYKNRNMTGTIDEFRIYDRILNLSEVAYLYECYDNCNPTISTNFTITAINEYNNESITNFSATIDGITYNTTTGTIITHLLSNDTNLYNIEITTPEFYLIDKTYTNINVSSNYEAQIDQYHFFETKNIYSNENITNFTVNIKTVHTVGLDYVTNYYSINDYNGKAYINLSELTISRISTINITQSNYFTYFDSIVLPNEYNFPINDNSTYYLKQSQINFGAKNIITNTTITNFNITINATTKNSSDTWYLSEGIYDATFSKAGFYDLTQEISINALDNKTITILGVFNNKLRINAFDKLNSSIDNFTIYLTLLNTTYSGYNMDDNTTAGFVEFGVINGRYNITIDAEGYEIKSAIVNVTSGNYTQYNFSLYTTNSILFTVYDELTGDILNNQIDVIMISDAISYNFNITNGSKYLDLFSPQSYIMIFSTDGYQTRTYSFTLNDRSFNEFNVYMINSTLVSEITATVYTQGYANIVEGAYIKVLRYFSEDNTYRIVETIATNFQGIAILNLVKNTQYYKFIIEYPFGTVGFSSNPTIITTDSLNFEIQTQGDNYFDTYFNVSSLITFNNLTNNFKLDFNSETTSRFCLDVIEYYRGTETRIQKTCLNDQTGSILINIVPKNNSKYTARSYVSFDSGESYLFLSSKTVEFLSQVEIDEKVAYLLILFLTIGFIFSATISSFMLLLTPMPLIFGILLGYVSLSFEIGIGLFVMVFAILIMLRNQI